MSIKHPTWCLRTEEEGADHVSRVVHAALPTDITDIQLRLSQAADESDDETLFTMLEVRIIEDCETSFYPLGLPQGRLLRDRLNEILPPLPPNRASVQDVGSRLNLVKF